MAVSSEYAAHVADILAPLARRASDLRIRNMFGGAGVYYRKLMFGLIAGEVLHFKADASTHALYKEHGCGPFVFKVKGKKPIAMSFWQVPESVMDDSEELLQWARRAIEVAQSAKNKKASPKKRDPRASTEQTLKENASWLI